MYSTTPSKPSLSEIVKLAKMSDEEVPEIRSDDELENPMRVVMVINSSDHPEGEMEERLLDSIQSLKEVNAFFDKFDEEVAIPNDGHIKYEVGSDGLVVIITDNAKLHEIVIKFVDNIANDKETVDEDEQNVSKKVKK